MSQFGKLEGRVYCRFCLIILVLRKRGNIQSVSFKNIMNLILPHSLKLLLILYM